MKRFLQRFKQGELRLGRLEAFSDGVFAIVVTLLVLELHVPSLGAQAHSPGELARQLVALLPKFLSWLISFNGWFHRGTACGRIVQNNVQRVIDTGAVFCQLRFAPSGERLGENVAKIRCCLLRQLEAAFRG